MSDKSGKPLTDTQRRMAQMGDRLRATMAAFTPGALEDALAFADDEEEGCTCGLPCSLSLEQWREQCTCGYLDR